MAAPARRAEMSGRLLLVALLMLAIAAGGHPRRARLRAYRRLSALRALPDAAHAVLCRHSAGGGSRRSPPMSARRACCSRCCSALLALLMLYNAGLGAYHAGVEWGFWEGPASCAPSVGVGSAADMLDQLQNAHAPSCTEATWRFLGLSFAGWNVRDLGAARRPRRCSARVRAWRWRRQLRCSPASWRSSPRRSSPALPSTSMSRSIRRG